MDKMLELAIAQFTGFTVAMESGPAPAIELVVSMGLTRKEWNLIQDDIEWFPREEWQEINQYFAAMDAE